MNKPFYIVALVGSLAANAVLAFVLPRSTPPATPPAASATPQPVASTPAPLLKLDWKSLQRDEPVALKNILDQAGVPTNAMRAIVRAQVRASFASRRRAIDPGIASRPFWQTSPSDLKTRRALRALDMEERQKLCELLGPEAEGDSLERAFAHVGLHGLAADKGFQAEQVLRDFSDLRAEVFDFVGFSSILTEDRKKLIDLAKAERLELAKILSPDQLENYYLRTSSTAMGLRHELAAFNPTEEEFRAYFRLQHEVDEKLGPVFGTPSPEESRLRQEQQAIVRQQFMSGLPADRAMEFQRASDPTYRLTNQVVTRLGLPAETTLQVWQLKVDFEARAAALKNEPTLAPAERARRAADLSAQAAGALMPVLGQRGLETYRQYGGAWLQALESSTGIPPRT